MGKGLKSGASKSASHQLFKDRAKNRVDDLQGMFSDLQVARKESRNVEVAVLEEQLHQMLREWKAELNEPSPASSLQQGDSLGSFSSEIYRLLHLCDEEDDATSGLAAPKPEPDRQKDETFAMHEGITVGHVQPEESTQFVDHCKGSQSGINIGPDNINLHPVGLNNMSNATHFDYHSFNLSQDLDQQYLPAFDDSTFCVDNGLPQVSHFAQDVSPPPSAFLGAKCALWDCSRPARVWCQNFQDYCSDFHQAIAPSEGCLGMAPVLRPGGIGLKDSLLFAALCAKAEGKDVGIPECEGAATAKSPWNAHELFDLKVLEGETIREWLFFDKPRRAFESGNRKQRSLPDYNGRGWHESRKQLMNEFGGLKRSYYMDPQPMEKYEWHLYEYEITKYDTCALYRLELKFVEKKKSPKGKVATNDSVADLQKQMGRLTAESQSEKRNAKGRAKASVKEDVANLHLTPTSNAAPQTSNVLPTSGEFDFGASPPYDDYLVDNPTGYY
ncbi:DNA-binding transcription factor [Lithospermum erythrorhizon]|uniref:DNA-binding transcription factor n=1 Tax=Lithospermum erythrorhizon TaxID=34254 RepID=A0AAV3PZC4_LITER